MTRAASGAIHAHSDTLGLESFWIQKRKDERTPPKKNEEFKLSNGSTFPSGSIPSAQKREPLLWWSGTVPCSRPPAAAISLVVWP